MPPSTIAGNPYPVPVSDPLAVSNVIRLPISGYSPRYRLLASNLEVDVSTGAFGLTGDESLVRLRSALDYTFRVSVSGTL